METNKDVLQDITLIYRLDNKVDYDNPIHLKKVAESLQQKNSFKSVIGRKYYREVVSLANGKPFSNRCVVCGQIRDAKGMLCSECTAKIVSSHGEKSESRNTKGTTEGPKEVSKAPVEAVTTKDILMIKVIPISILVIYLLWQLFLWWLATLGVGVFYSTEYYGDEFYITSGHGSVNYESLMFFVKLCGSYLLYNIYEGILFRAKTKRVEAYLAAKHPWYGARISGKLHAFVIIVIVLVVVGILVSQFTIQAPTEEEMIQFFNRLS